MQVDQKKISRDREKIIRQLEKALKEDSDAMKMKYKPRCINNSYHNIAIKIKYEADGDFQIKSINNPDDDLERNAWVTMNKSQDMFGFVTIDDSWSDLMSHHTVDVSKDGKPKKLDQFVYVDEQSCIGCTMCATCAPNTFLIERDFGRARVLRQGHDDSETVAAAIASCPVNCIDYVNWNDLVALEMERQNASIDPNSYWVKLEGILYMNADTLAKENRNFNKRIDILKENWARKMDTDNAFFKINPSDQEVGI